MDNPMIFFGAGGQYIPFLKRPFIPAEAKRQEQEVTSRSVFAPLSKGLKGHNMETARGSTPWLIKDQKKLYKAFTKVIYLPWPQQG